MSGCRRVVNQSVLLRIFCVVCVSALITVTAVAQDEPLPKVELFTGYQWINPGADVPAPFHPSNNPVSIKAPSMGNGLGISGTYNFSRVWGFETDFGHNWNDFGYETTVGLGPRLSWRSDRTNLFGHGMLAYNRFNINGIGPSNGIGAILGGGMDVRAWKHLSIRLFEADYVWAHHNFSDAVDPAFGSLRRPNLNGARLRTGLVWDFGGAPQIPPTASCSVQPNEVMVGEPITATATVANFNPKHTLTYNWNSTGGKVTSKDQTATIDTNGVAGGSYTVTARVSDPKVKKGGEVSCTSNFTVKEPPKNPPTMSCTANPTTVQAGQTRICLAAAPVPTTCQ